MSYWILDPMIMVMQRAFLISSLCIFWGKILIFGRSSNQTSDSCQVPGLPLLNNPGACLGELQGRGPGGNVPLLGLLLLLLPRPGRHHAGHRPQPLHQQCGALEVRSGAHWNYDSVGSAIIFIIIYFYRQKNIWD